MNWTDGLVTIDRMIFNSVVPGSSPASTVTSSTYETYLSINF